MGPLFLLRKGKVEGEADRRNRTPKPVDAPLAGSVPGRELASPKREAGLGALLSGAILRVVLYLGIGSGRGPLGSAACAYRCGVPNDQGMSKTRTRLKVGVRTHGVPRH
jgi:hypothetical protein